MEEFLPYFAISIGFIITITAILSDTISKYKLKVEKIKADALVRSEEVRTRNQLELERLLRQDELSSAGSINSNDAETVQTLNHTKSKGRVRE